jgi:methylated-DNA-[protein]-cysteine S-methyltransferase
VTANAEASVERLVSSPAGDLVLRAGARGLRYLGFTVERRKPTAARGPVTPLDAGEASAAVAVLDQAERELREYFARDRRQFSVPLDLTGTGFQLAVWNALLRLPYGATVTYRGLARAVDRPAAFRAAGAANGANPIAIIVPCHRVVGSDGSLRGYAGGLDVKRYLLDLEQRRPPER